MVLSVATLLWVLQDIMQFNLSIPGASLDTIQKETRALHNKNMELKTQIYYLEALTTISREAKNIGFIDGSKSIIYIK